MSTSELLELVEKVGFIRGPVPPDVAMNLSNWLSALFGGAGADYARLIAYESRWNTTAVNASTGAAGLIQHLPSRLREIGVEPRLYPTQGLAMQFLAVVVYFRDRLKEKRIGRLTSAEDVYMTVFQPRLIGESKNEALPASQAAVNRGIVTYADYVREVSIKGDGIWRREVQKRKALGLTLPHPSLR